VPPASLDLPLVAFGSYGACWSWSFSFRIDSLRRGCFGAGVFSCFSNAKFLIACYFYNFGIYGNMVFSFFRGLLNEESCGNHGILEQRRFHLLF
jgi:hypothetical protein